MSLCLFGDSGSSTVVSPNKQRDIHRPKTNLFQQNFSIGM